MKRTATLILLVLSCALLASESLLWQDGGIPLYTNNYVEYSGSCLQHEDGSFMLLWSENITGYSNLQTMRIDSSGNQLWDEPRAVTDDIWVPNSTHMIGTSDGDLLIVWYHHDSNSDFFCHAMKINWDATPLWDQPVEITDNYETKYPALECFPDSNGGAYVLWNESYNNYPNQYVQHIDADGELDWEDGAVELFPSYYNVGGMFSICADGQGGIIVSSVAERAEDYSLQTLVQRVTPDAETPWGDNGYICLNEIHYYWDFIAEIQQTDDDEYALFSTWSDSTGTGFRMHRLNRDGEILDESNYPLEYAFDSRNRFRADCDSEHNLIIGWAEKSGNYCRIQIGKITPDNVLHWYSDEEVGNAGILGGVLSMELTLDENDNIYQSWILYDYNSRSLWIQKYDHDGNPLWEEDGTFVIDNVDSISGTSMNYSDGSSTLFWMDDRTGMSSIYCQSFDSSGSTLFGDEGIPIRQGWESSGPTALHSDAGNAGQDYLYFAWVNNYDHSCYLQCIDMNGNFTMPDNGRIFLDNSRYSYVLHAVENIDDDVYIVWTQTGDLFTSTRMNRFDTQGNRVWDQDLVVYETETYGDVSFSNVTVGKYLDDLMIGWEESIHYFERVRLQRVSDGQLAWGEPARIGEESVHNLNLMKIVDNYVVWLDNIYRVLRIADDGTPCEGWELEGTRITSINGSHNDWHYFNTESGLVLVWSLDNGVTDTIRLQLVYRDGTTEWINSYAIEIAESVYNTCATVDGKELYVGWNNGYVNLAAFSLGGDALWDSTIVIEENWRLTDLQTTPDGLLFSYYYSNSGYYQTDVGMQHLSMDGETWNEPLTVCDAQNPQTNLDILKAENDRYFLTWLDNRDGVGGYTPYMQMFDYQATGTDGQSNTPAWDAGLQVTPNPFNPETTVRFSLLKNANVNLSIYNTKGQLVRKLYDGLMPAGNHGIPWDGTDRYQKPVATGVYLINLDIDGTNYRSKSLLLK